MTEIRPGYKAIAFPPGVERIASMINFNDRIIVATDAGVYELIDGMFHRLEFVEAEDSRAVGQ